MLRRSKIWNRAIIVIATALALESQSILAENRLLLRKGPGNSISVQLSNTDPIAGFQFSIIARGGITLGSYEGSDRTATAGLGVYQYLVDDSTLNVVLLAPYRSSLSAGVGVIGKVSFTLNRPSGSDTARVFLNRVVICNAAAQYLEVTTSQLAWTTQENSDTQTSGFTLEQNFPNPFNPSTTITYRLEKPDRVRLEVHDIAGRLVSTLVDQYQSIGRYTVKWNAYDGISKLASGMYFASLHVGNMVAVGKMILTK